MKREFLKNLGLEDDKIDSIMAEHGKTVTTLNTKATDLTSQVTDVNNQLKQRDKDIKDLKKNAGDNEELTTKLSDLQKKYDDDTNSLQAKVKATQTASAIKLALHDKTHDVDLVAGLIDTKQLVISDDGNITAGLDEQLKTLQESKSFLFIQNQTAPTVAGVTPTEGNPLNTPKSTNEMTYSEMVAYMESNPGAKI